MRIQNKYLRNRHFRIKYWKRIRATEHPFETFMPWFRWNSEMIYSAEEQVKNHFDWIDKQARHLESGKVFSMNSAPANFRRTIVRINKAKERQAMQKINNGDYDTEVPLFKQDAAWEYW